jgi:hypothetical protein
MVLVQKAFYCAGHGCRLSVIIMFEGATFYDAAGVVNCTWGATSEENIVTLLFFIVSQRFR